MANNNAIYNAIIQGAGGAFTQRWITNSNAASYSQFKTDVEGVATTVDGLIAATTISGEQAKLMQTIAQGVFSGRYPQGQSTWAGIAAAIVALYTSLSASLLPVTGGGGGIEPPAGQIGGTAINPLVIGLTTEGGIGDELDISIISNQSLLSRVGNSLISAALGVGLSFAAGTLSLSAVSNTAQGVVPQTNGIAGQALIATAGGTTWGNNFQNQNLTTSGTITASTASNGFALGSTVATTGSFRWAHGVNIVGRNNGNTADRTILDWGVTSTDNLHIGDGAVTLVLNCSNSGQGFNVRTAGTTRLTISTTFVTVHTAGLAFESTVASPKISQITTTVNGVTAQSLELTAQDATGTTTTGGAMRIRPGTGTSVNGEGSLLSADLQNRFRWNTTGIGLYAKTPVSQAARVGQAVDSTGGTASGTRTFVDVNTAGVADITKINNNFATLVANMWNPLELAISNLGVTA